MSVPFSKAITVTGMPSKSAMPPDHRFVVTKTSVAVEFYKVRKEALNKSKTSGTVFLSCSIDVINGFHSFSFPSSEAFSLTILGPP